MEMVDISPIGIQYHEMPATIIRYLKMSGTKYQVQSTIIASCIGTTKCQLPSINVRYHTKKSTYPIAGVHETVRY